jgi:TRAP-type transport system small permease protein
LERYNPLEWLVGALMLALVTVVFTQVVVRYATYQPLAWTEEVAQLLFIWICLVGAAAGSIRARHFAIAFLSSRLHGAAGGLIRACIRLAEAVFYVSLAWGGIGMTRVAHQQQSVVLGFPMSLGYGIIPIAALIMLAATLYHAVSEFRR